MFQPSLFMNIANIKNRLQQLGIPASEIANVNRNDQNAVNDFAKKVMTGFMQKDPNIANQIKDVARNVGADEVVQVIDSNK